MTALVEGPFLAVCGLLAAAGADKALRPDTTAKALSAAGHRVPRWMVRAGAVAELAVGAGAAATGNNVLAAAVAMSYLAFVAFVAVALSRRWPLATCGCFATVDTPPTAGHVALDLAAAAVAATAAIGGAPTLASALRGQYLLGIPFLVSCGAVAGLMFLLMTFAPRLGAVRRSLVRGAP